MSLIENHLHIRDFDVLHVHSPFNPKKPGSYLSACIRFFQKWRWGPEAAYWSHTAIALWHHGELYIYEADPYVKKTPFKTWVKNKEISLMRVHASEWVKHGGDLLESRAILKSKLGIRYDYLSLVFFQILYILSGRWFGTKNSNSFYCSELTSWILYVSTGMFPDWYRISPCLSYHRLKDWKIYEGPASKLVVPK